MPTFLVAIAVFAVFYGIGAFLIELPTIKRKMERKPYGFTPEEMEITRQLRSKRMVRDPQAYLRRDEHLS